MLKRKLRKMTSLILAFGMIVSLTPSSVWAEGTPTDSPVIEGSSEETTETTEAATEVETTEATTEQQPTDKTEIIPTFDKIYNDVNVDGLDFGSCELLIATEDSSIFTADTEVVSEYDGVFLTRYPDAEQTKSAYTYYYDKADMVDVNAKIKINDNESDNKDDTEEVAEDDEDVPQQETTIENSDEAISNEGHGEADLTNINKEDESLANLNEIDKIKDYSGFIALIDTGAKKENNVKESISLIGDKADDDNGHGTKMVEAITSVNKDAKILSIKALDKDGTGNVSDVYAAINYAIEAKVSVINLSMSSVQTAESQLLKEAIEDAVSKDIIVVVSAGNNGKKAKYYTPANIEKAYTIGAADKDGNRLSTSNYGDVVDYYVVAESTSEASAIFSGYASISIDEAIKNTIELKKAEEETIESDEIEETEEASETDAEENIQHDENGFMLHVNSIPDSDAAPWYSLGSSGGYELWRSKNMGHDSTTEGNRTWWYLGWYNGSAIKWSAKAYCLDPDKQAPPSTGSASIIYDGAGVNITKAYFWSKADLMQYYTNGQTIYEEGDPKSNNHSQYNINWLNMGNDRTSNLLRYASSGSATYGRTDTVTYGNAVADYNTVTSYDFPSSTAQYVSWDDADLASNAVPSDAAWYEEPVFRNIYIVKAKKTALATGTFSTPSASDWVFNTRYNQMHLKNYITYTGGEDGKSMFIGKVPSGTQFTVHGSSGTTKTFIAGQLFVIYSGDKLDIWVDADSIGTSYIVNEDTTVEHGSRAYGYSVAIRQYTSATQRMGYLNSIQSPSQSFSYSVPNAPKPKVDLEKSSSNPTYTNGNPNYSLAGATFQIYKGTTLVTSLVTDASGNTAAVEIPLVYMDTNSDGDIVDTTFSYKETVTPKGYINQATEGYFTVPVNNTGIINETNTGGTDFINLTISKQDSTGSDELNGDSTLAGAEFTVKFYPQDITGNLNTSQAASQTWVFQTKQDPNDSKKFELRFLRSFLAPSCTNMTYFDATTGVLELPYGFITIQETKAPNGYKTNGDFNINGYSADANGIMIFRINPDQEYVYAGGSYHAVDADGKMIKEDVPIRADIIIKKVDHNGDPMANVEFEIKCNETGETVKVMTDEEGIYCSASTYVPHSTNTNAGTPKSGTWFGDINNIDDNLGALYQGTYTVTELRCEANKGKQLEKAISVTIGDAQDSQIIPVVDANAADAQDYIYNFPMPIIETDAIVEETGSKTMGQAGGEEDPTIVDYTDQTIVDDMYYQYLRENTNFVALTELMVIDPSTGNVEPYMEDDGNGNEIPYKRLISFKTDAGYDYSRYEKTGHVPIRLEHVDPTGLEGKKFVVYETVYLDDTANPYTKVEDLPDDDNALQYDGYDTMVDVDGKNISEMYFFPLRHNDPDDTRQQVYPGDLHTHVMGKETGDNIGYAGTETFIDRVYFTGLTIGEEYTINGQVYLKDDNTSNNNSNNNGNNNTAVTPTPLTDKDGKPVTASKTFIADVSDGFIDLEFTIDAAELMGERVVVFEDEWQGDKKLAVHADINDSDEFYYIPSIHTSTRNGKVDKTKITDKNKDSSKEVLASAEGESFIDTISYESLICNREFKVKGVLMDKATGEVMKDATGKEIKAETTFKTKEVGEIKITDSPDAKDYQLADGTVLDMSADHADYLANGTVDLEFKGYDFTTLAGKTGVVYEEVYLIKTDADGNKKEYLVGDHKKLDDIDQFTYFVSIGTKAEDTTTGIKVVPKKTATVVKDTISFKNLQINKKYVFTATFAVKNDKSGKYKDGDKLLDKDGNVVSATVEFTPTTKDGTTTVDIPLDSTVLEDMQLVVFENCKNELGIEIAAHESLEDEGQRVYVPGGKTTATDGNGKKTVKAGKVTIYDTLKYSNLEPNKEYTATGKLMLKETNEPLKDANGNEITNTVKFTPTTSDGEIRIPFEVDASLLGGKTIVVFEDVFYNQKEVFIEHNINDEDQSITVSPPTTPPKTGMLILFILIGIMAVGGAGMLIFRRKRA